MSNKDESVFFNDDAVMDFLRSNWDLSKGVNSDNYEFVVALIMRRFCEDKWKEPCQIGFKIKASHMHKIPKKGSITLKDLSDLLINKVEDDHPVDISIVKGAWDGKPKGMDFQIKRFGFNGKNTTEDFAQYLNSLKTHYARANGVRLIVFLEKGSDLDIEKLIPLLDTTDFPFDAIMYSGMTDGKVIIGEVYPVVGYEDYPVNDFVGIGM